MKALSPSSCRRIAATRITMPAFHAGCKSVPKGSFKHKLSAQYEHTPLSSLTLQHPQLQLLRCELRDTFVNRPICSYDACVRKHILY
ncbi:hypothetical protein BAUCODRAFT_402500 [Baudoinia panamericana UAMH 10762]|uniref:Uncharacterized protein n=1 Tax=Baudoinia panamericana (strain UAMH 10762) TaxID=717646 RepID=M2N5U5_BAUPA|nr:uncharacterized protein BAUCODRAFT_402500 [Baudoinia panamericana UAMH 10762]EMC99398.1 hypothetical protein BAUCODRAFT_402500 [Baudoinia panamericana UAMH 10762]